MNLARIGARILIRAATPLSKPLPMQPACRLLSSSAGDGVRVTDTRVEKPQQDIATTKASTEKVLVDSCGDVDDSDDEMEQEEMFVEPHESFEHKNVREWGGPRRGGRLPEPTRFGDWERKGRCTDF